MILSSALLNFFKKIGPIIYPDYCIHCNSICSSRICLTCEYQLRQHYDLLPMGNLFYSHFYNCLSVPYAASLYPFIKEGVFQSMIHALKYRSDKAVGTLLGQHMGNHILNHLSHKPDVIIPVPLHPKKLQKRGYNQSEVLAGGIQDITQIPVDTSWLIRKIHGPSQTKKSKKERITSLANSFELRADKKCTYQHILLVDDVITTGSTLHACINALSQHKNLKISVLVAGMGQ